MSTPNLALISQHLNCSIDQIILEEWLHVYFVKVPGKRPTFLSKKRFSIQTDDGPFLKFHGSDYLNQFLSMTFNSQCLDNGCYSQESNTLSLRFHSGSSYEYFNVPPAIWQELIKPYVSPGKAYNILIKGKYRGCKVAWLK